MLLTHTLMKDGALHKLVPDLYESVRYLVHVV